MTREYIAPKCKFTISDGRVFTEADRVFNVTGTSIGALIGASPYETPFTASAKMLGLWGEDISNKPAVLTGKLLEERIIDYVAMKHPDVGQFFKAEDLFAERTGNHEDWASDFEDEDFHGHVDGIISRDGQDYILEVKTVRDLSAWSDGVPPHYLWQVYLYNHFMTHQDKAYFAIGMVTSETYANPYGWVPNSQNCILIEVPIDQKAVAAKIEEVRAIRRCIVEERATLPADLNDPRDKELMVHLLDISGDTDRLLEAASRYEALMRELDEAESNLKAKKDEAESYKARIKDMMEAHSLSRCNNLSISVQKRETFDFAKARAELDADTLARIEPYFKTSSTKILRRTKI